MASYRGSTDHRKPEESPICSDLRGPVDVVTTSETLIFIIAAVLICISKLLEEVWLLALHGLLQVALATSLEPPHGLSSFRTLGFGFRAAA